MYESTGRCVKVTLLELHQAALQNISVEEMATNFKMCKTAMKNAMRKLGVCDWHAFKRNAVANTNFAAPPRVELGGCA